MQTPLMSARRRNRLNLFNKHDAVIINLGQMEIWDGADLALVRDTLFELIAKKQHKSVGIDMSWVKYVPSGFFGMLSDWHDQGIRIILVSPQQNVREMIWCRQFFREFAPDCLLLSTPSRGEFLLIDEDDEWSDEAASLEDSATQNSNGHDEPVTAILQNLQKSEAAKDSDDESSGTRKSPCLIS